MGKRALLLVAVAALVPSAAGQLADLQPGPNFSQSVSIYSPSRAQGVDLGDVDNDGDLDVGIARGFDGSPRVNPLLLNQGGAQGGQAGSFADVTDARFDPLPADTTRDLAFFDMDDDGDLDVFVANYGTLLPETAQVSRVHRNLGGRQHGPVGFFDEHTDAFWGDTVSVPPEQQLGEPDDHGPWAGWSHVVDFADVDDDGDLDVFVGSHGPLINGMETERLFLNDGLGTVHELWPWADAGADLKWHTNDLDFADLDGDFDLDLFASSRDSQARVFRNEFAEGQPGGTLFTDVTQSALVDTGSAYHGSENYAAELGDLDGDGDFDAWMVNYGFNGPGLQADALLANDGALGFRRTNAAAGLTTAAYDAVKFLDFDSDGDLDVHVTGFSNSNVLFQSSVAQPLADPSVFLHRTGVGAPGAQAPQVELTSAVTGGSPLDAAFADLDGDGDPDGVIVMAFNSASKYTPNVLGVPDTHAPTFEALTLQPDKADGTPTVIHAALRDNAGVEAINRYRAELVFRVDGGPETCTRLVAQGGQQFRGVLPAGLDGVVSYHARVVDQAGNVGVSATHAFVQSAPGIDAFLPIDCGTPGVAGTPLLLGSGTLTPDADTHLTLRHAAPDAFAIVFLAAQSTPVPFKQGTLHPFPVNAFLNRSTDAGGLDALDFAWPDTSALPSGTELWLQYGVQDATVLGAGASLSNALRLHVP